MLGPREDGGRPAGPAAGPAEGRAGGKDRRVGSGDAAFPYSGPPLSRLRREPAQTGTATEDPQGDGGDFASPRRGAAAATESRREEAGGEMRGAHRLPRGALRYLASALSRGSGQAGQWGAVPAGRGRKARAGRHA